MKLTSLILTACLLAVPMGCHKTTPTNPAYLAPGAYNQADQTLYGFLMIAQASINSLKASEATNPTLKPYLNQAIMDYNIAEVAWQTYHASLANSPNASPAAAQAAIDKLNTDLSKTPQVKP